MVRPRVVLIPALACADRCLHSLLDIVKKQAEQNQKEYDRLATEFNKATGAVSDKRKD